MSRSTKDRVQSGYVIAETAAAVALILPAALIMLYAVWEACRFILIVNSLQEAARQAARGCAIAYASPDSGPYGTANSAGTNVAPPQPQLVNSEPPITNIQGLSDCQPSHPPTTPNQAFANVRISNIITDNQQFSAAYQPPAVNCSNTAYTMGRVTVTVRYTGPLLDPDILNISPHLSGIPIAAAHSCTLEQ